MAYPPPDFYIYLTNRDNKNAAIATAKLPTRMDITNFNYEMALIEIQAPKHWYNVTDCSFQIFNIEDYKTLKTRPINLPNGYYKNFQDIFKWVNAQTELRENRIATIPAARYANFWKDPNNQYHIVLAPNGAIAFSNRFRELLGLTSPSYTNRNEEDEERIRLHPNLFLDQYSVIAKCDLIEPVLVENRMDNILRIFSTINLDQNQMLNLVFNPIYIPIATNLLDTIKIEIKDMRDRPIKMAPGEIVILIHLRRS